MRKPDNPIIKELFRNFTLISQLGFSVIISILLFVFGFVYIDKKLDTNGDLVIVGIVLGVIVGILAAYRLVKKHFKD
jgi:galactitol-specific phosphotransferase system IIC component